MFNAWPPPFFFSSSLVANPVKKVFEKLGRDLVIVLGRIFADIIAIFKEKKLKGQFGFRRFGYIRTDPNIFLFS
jgi:hypothetical protein